MGEGEDHTAAYEHYLNTPEGLLNAAIREQNVLEVQRLISTGVSVDGNEHDIPIEKALKVGNEKIMKMLLEAGADPGEVCSNEDTYFGWDTPPLKEAVKKGQTTLIGILLEYSVLRKTPFDKGVLDRMLRQALKAMNIDIITLLFNHGATIDPEQSVEVRGIKEIKRFWVHLAAGWDGSEEVLLDLLARKIYPVDIQQGDGQTTLHLACTLGYRRAVKKLIDFEADLNIQDNLGQTPLHKVAAWHGLDDLSLMLLEHGAEENLRDHDGKTASDVALVLEPNAPHQSSDDAPDTGSEEELKQLESESELITAPQKDSHDTRVFSEVVRGLSVQIPAPHWALEASKCPKRLIDIHTGEVVFEAQNKKYVIVSYIWSPEKYKSQDPAYFLDSHQSLIPGFFDEVIDSLINTSPSMIQKTPSSGKNIRQPTSPRSHISSAYFQEVYMLAAMEADRRGLHYIWMDGMCIDQTQPSDKEAEIPFMADYYRGAECCVVISELLRQKLCVSWRDFQPEKKRRRRKGPKDTLDDWPVLPNESLFAWIIGYHHHRVWTFQETFLAREVVVCGSGVRIHASKVVEARTKEHGLTRHQGNERFSVLAEHFPLRNSGIVSSAKALSFSHCLQLLHTRECFLEHDRIYGILGLFPASLRQSVPVDYSISLGAALANYLFASICVGELVNLLMVRDADHPAHRISNAPSWLPTGYGSPFEKVVDMAPHPDLRFSAQPSIGSLTLHMQYLSISDVQIRNSTFSKQLQFGHHNTVIRAKDFNDHALPFLAAVAVEPLGPWIRNFESWSSDSRSIFNENAKAKLDKAKMNEENSIRRQRIRVAAADNRAVMATFGVRKLTNTDRGSRPDMWLWLILCTDDERKTWRREGVGITGKMECEMRSREFVIY